jgi:soluble lytic murein transglycosylase-like protein
MHRVSALLLAAFLPPVSADVYIATAPDGAPMLTNVPADTNWRLFLRDPGPPARVPAPYASGRRSAYERLVVETSRQYGLDPRLLHAVIAVESGYDARAVSRAGAMGLMQLMPTTARRWGVTNPFDARQNLRGGAGHLRRLLQVFEGDLRLSLAAYNAGEGAVRRHGNRIPCNAETPRYVHAVLSRYAAAGPMRPPPRGAAAPATSCPLTG